MNTPLDDLRVLVSIPSFSGKEDAAANWVYSRLESEGFEPARLVNNVWAFASGYDPEKPTLLLNSHLDTVAICQGWTVEPHAFTQNGTTCYGLGINDAGASLIGLLHVFLLEEAERKAGKQSAFNLLFLASAEEENSGKNGMERVREELGSVAMAIVGEPTGGNIAVAEKGLLVIDAVARGVAGHAARNTGENAIYKALNDIRALQQYTFPLVSETLGPVSLHITAIEGGKLHNVIPDSCSFTIDIRLNDCYSHAEVLETLQEICESELTPRSMRLCPSGLPEQHPLRRAAAQLGLKQFGSPTMSDQALMPWPSIKFGIGESERSHTANEFIETHELTTGIALYKAFLNQLEHEIMG